MVAEIAQTPSQDTEAAATVPHNLDAEQAILGAILYENATYHLIADWLKPEHFHDPVHVRIFEAIGDQIGIGNLCDPITLKAKLEQDDGLAQIGGTAYLVELVQSAPLTSNAAVEYGRIVAELALRRALIRVSDEMGYAARQDSDDPATTLIEEAEASLAALTDTEEGETEYTAGQALRAALDQPLTFIETGLRGFDDMRTISPALIIVGARSSMGKSAIVADQVLRSARNGKPSLMLTNEMTARQIAARWAASMTGVPYFAITNGTMHQDQRDRVAQCIAEIETLPITIIECPGIGISGLRSRIRRWLRKVEKAGQEPGVVGLDYLQNIAGQGGSLYERTSDIALGLQTIQLTFGICLLVACQLARAAEHEKDKRPSIRHLRDSGKIEEVADKILLVYRDSYYAEREPQEDDATKEMQRRERAASKLVEVDLAKNRLGPLGRIKLMGDMACNHFEDWGA